MWLPPPLAARVVSAAPPRYLLRALASAHPSSPPSPLPCQVVWGRLIGITLLHEPMTAAGAAGVALVASGVALVATDRG